MKTHVKHMTTSSISITIHRNVKLMMMRRRNGKRSSRKDGKGNKRNEKITIMIQQKNFTVHSQEEIIEINKAKANLRRLFKTCLMDKTCLLMSN